MATHKSAEKRNRQNINRRNRNRSSRSAVRTAIKDARSAIESGAPNAGELVREAERMVAKAASKGLYHTRNAARKVSRLNRYAASKAS